jgi:hypothetical protein
MNAHFWTRGNDRQTIIDKPGGRDSYQTSLGETEMAFLRSRSSMVVAVAVLGFQLYQAKNEPTGVHINLGQKGLSIESK